MVVPTNLKPRFFSAFDKASEAGGAGGDLRQAGGVTDLWLIIDKRPDEIGKVFAFGLHG